MYVPLPSGVTAKMLDVQLNINDIRIGYKGKKDEPALLEGKWCKKIKQEESLWNIEREGDKSTMTVTIEKFEGRNWWTSML